MQKKAIFLDRDGVLNVKRDDYVKTENELVIFPKVGRTLKLLQNNGFELFIITNQSVINRGIITPSEEEKINNKLLSYLLEYDVKITKIYICPHRPDENCSCRKPKTGLIEKAASDHNIDLQKSWFIGDSLSDKNAALTSGCRFIMNKTNGDINLLVDFILDNS